MRTYLRGKVSRRLMLQFVLAALVPMSGVAWYAYHQVSTLLLNSAYERLRADSKSFGMSVIESLNVRASALEHLSRANIGNTQTATRSGFTGTSLQPLATLTAAQQSRIGHGGTVLRLVAGRPVELVAATDLPGRVLVGRIDAMSLWVSDFAPERYCVLDANFVELFCTPGLVPLDQQTLRSTLGAGTGGTVPWKLAGEDLLVGLWRPKFLPTFDSPGFVIMQVTSRADALRTLNTFRQFFPLTFLLALALATALAVRQIQRQMKPLGLLTDVSQRLATGDLGARMPLAGDDEFTALGATFNDMAGSLEYRFHMLAMLSELDRAIISATGMEHVASEVLGHIRKAIPCDGAGLLVHSGEQGFHLLTRDPAQAAGCLRTSSRSFEVTGLDPTRAASILSPGILPQEFLDRLCPVPPAQLVAFAIRNDGRLEQVLLLAYARRPASMDDVIQGGRALADRLGIALSSLAQEARLYHQAHHDSLTDLPNRVLLRERCEQAIARAQRDGTCVALILIDLDNFKQVNDTLGHASGDELLSQCAMVLARRMRPGDTLARLGGDEFVVLLPDLAAGQDRQVLDERLRELMGDLSVPLAVHGYQINTPASMGVALYPTHAGHFDELLQMADAAMYKAKREQRGGFQFYTSELNTQSKAHFDLTQELRKAVERDELVLHFQPKVNARRRDIVGAEALVRWRSPSRGLVSPGVFVHLLDEMGLGVWLGEWVLDRACAQMRQWQDSGLRSIPVSVNMSPSQFERASVLEVVRASLDRYRLDARCLEIEILEATAVNDSDKAMRTLLALRAEGVRVALDDFGTGYSSLVYLTRIPADVLKLDQAFIRRLSSDARQQEIVRHIIALAKTLSYTVVAEGVEEEAQLSVLVAMGCDLVQGYLIGSPVPPDAFAERWLR
ncbi:putative bifunctional diguanylate cyclase/phosphodiesterase [Rhodanobacter caeni]|uniref:GGDEF domain-containing protein n=1 Tax=Rhodanobacter caeni TaxID=657654 RepID=A0ABN0UC88_9GAMM